MKGNLSKKKGFLGKLEGEDLSSIADILEVKYGDRLAEAESEIGEVKKAKEDTANKVNEINLDKNDDDEIKFPTVKAVKQYGNKITNEANAYTSDMFEEAVAQFERADRELEKQIEAEQKIAKELENQVSGLKNSKEDVSNKVNTMDFSTPSNTKYPTEYAVWEKLLLWDNSIKQYVSGFLKQDYYNKEFINESFEKLENKTLGGNYPITHPDCTIAKDEYYASLKYLKECFEYFRGEIGGSGGLVDLSNYFTKDETTRMIDFAIQNVYGAIGSEVKLIDENKEDVSNKVSVIDGLSPDKDKEYPTVWAVWNAVTDCENSAISYTDNAIGNIESALENIIEKYGLGGDAS